MTEQVTEKPGDDKEQYRKVITENITEAVRKSKESGEEKYWTWVIGQLMEDLKDYVSNGAEAWRKEPYDAAWKKYGPIQQQTAVADSFKAMDELMKRLFKDFGMDI